jgi:hypothetical protein
MNEMTHKASIGRREFLWGGLAAAAGVGLSAPGFSTSADELRAVHNMLIVGTRNTFLYHLPMFSFPGFDSPHRYQVILQAAFSQQGTELGDAFAKERRVFGESQIYTFSPDKFVLQDLNAQIQKTPLRQLSGTIFRGHLEKGGTAIFTDVTAAVRVVYFQELNTQLSKTRAPLRVKSRSHLQYILFGANAELFLAHVITMPPDFDQILPVTIPGRLSSGFIEPTNEELGQGFVLSFPQTTNTINRRLQAGAQVADTPEKPRKTELAEGGFLTTESGLMKLLVGKEIYLEEGELLVPPLFATTATEKAAGFP